MISHTDTYATRPATKVLESFSTGTLSSPSDSLFSLLVPFQEEPTIDELLAFPSIEWSETIESSDVMIDVLTNTLSMVSHDEASTPLPTKKRRVSRNSMVRSRAMNSKLSLLGTNCTKNTTAGSKRALRMMSVDP